MPHKIPCSRNINQCRTIVLNVPHFSEIFKKNKNNNNNNFIPPLDKKLKEIESSGLRHWKAKIKSYMKIYSKSWSDNMCGLQTDRSKLYVFIA